MTEEFLQYVWQHRLLEGDLLTLDGLPVTVEKAGIWNRDAGPDFINARLRVGDILWAGNVEIHLLASDWHRHHHDGDERYASLILHVVYSNDCDIVLPDGRRLPTLEIHQAIPAGLWERYEALVDKSQSEIPCGGSFANAPELVRLDYFDRLLVERMERKSADVRRLYDDSHHSWSDTCFWLVARYFGGTANAAAFEMLAKSVPLGCVAKIKDHPFRVEALLFGQAGLLEGDFADDYPQRLQQEYRYLAKAYGLTPMAGHLWRFLRMRPVSFPTIRISQLATLLCRSSALFSKMLEELSVDKLRQFFDLSASDYWSSHYRFDSPSATCDKRTGLDFAYRLLINAWTPLLFQYGASRDDQSLKDRAIALLRQIPAEDNRIVRLWKKVQVPCPDAAASQTLIQLHNEHCIEKRCLQCPIGHGLLASTIHST